MGQKSKVGAVLKSWEPEDSKTPPTFIPSSKFRGTTTLQNKVPFFKTHPLIKHLHLLFILNTASGTKFVVLLFWIDTGDKHYQVC